MPKRVSTIPVIDFQGGLNLNANALQLAENESPMMLNVDLDPLGGFRRRPAVVETARLDNDFWRLIALQSSSLDTFIFGVMGQGVGTFCFSLDGVDWTVVTTLSTPVGRHDVVVSPQGSSTEFAYLLSDSPPERWIMGSDGLTVGDLVAMGNTWSEDFEAPTIEMMVEGRIGCNHREYVFVAGTTTDQYRPNRVHFSHPGNAEAWREKDWFDVGDTRPITAMVSLKDTLLIFKQDSVWQVQGYDFDTFSLSNITNNAGAVNQKCVVASEEGVYFYSWPYGVYYMGANGLEYKSAKLQEYLVNKQMQPRNGNESLAWIDRRLYFSTGDYPSRDILWGGIGPTFTFVLDPLLPDDSWTLYSFPVVGNDAYYTNGGTNGLICGVGFNNPYSDVIGYGVLEESYDHVVRFTRNGSQTQGDMVTVNTPHEVAIPETDPVEYETVYTWDETNIPIEAYYMTGWQDIDNTAVVKSWGRPVVTMGNLEDAELHFDIYKNYDSINSTGFFDLTSDVSGSDVLTWDTGVWGVDAWSRPVGQALGIKKGRRIGRATAVALKVKCSQQFKPWSVDSIVWKYIPKRVRS